MDDILTLSLTELTAQMRARKVSPVELMGEVLDRIDATNDDLNAFVAMRDRESLVADAKRCEQRIQRGDARPLEGIPLGVKDLEHAEGLPNTEGSLIYKDRISDHDAIHVARLKAAGAIVIGKTNAPEFGHTAVTKNLVYGVTRSPWNLERTPGGSSGGSSAAVAACVCPLVTASDGGGSIRIPASFTGTFGLKPSYGRVPRGPIAHWDYDDTSCYGPLTRTVEDAALFLDLVAGPSPYDPNTLPAPGLSYVEALGEALPSGLRIGFSADLGYAVVQGDVAAAVEEAVGVFDGLGHRVSPVQGGPPWMGRNWGLLAAFEKSAHLHEHLAEREAEFGRAFIAGVKTGWAMSPERWREIGDQRVELNRWCAETFERFDLLVTPTVPYDPPPAKGPFPAETEGRKQPMAAVASFTIPFNLSWHPAATLRVGLSRLGLPIGMQIVGPRHREDLVLRAALAFQRERPWHPDWPTRWSDSAG
jgi:Asp-tRNA(Asn)/Glu-tRNA(Gln) amidotransferase A subunit family amidase